MCVVVAVVVRSEACDDRRGQREGGLRASAETHHANAVSSPASLRSVPWEPDRHTVFSQNFSTIQLTRLPLSCSLGSKDMTNKRPSPSDHDRLTLRTLRSGRGSVPAPTATPLGLSRRTADARSDTPATLLRPRPRSPCAVFTRVIGNARGKLGQPPGEPRTKPRGAKRACEPGRDDLRRPDVSNRGSRHVRASSTRPHRRLFTRQGIG